jgi:uncharacterized ferredoxin-like protein
MLIVDPETDLESLLTAARTACTAARTAPKGRGMDLLATAVLSGEDKAALTSRLRLIAEREEIPFFIRDADNIDASPVLILIGSRKQPLGLKFCGLCGFANCAAMLAAGGTCSFNAGDLGIALGSAVSRLADWRIDNRIMYTVGMAAKELEILGPQVELIYGIPLSITGKSPYFDRH